MGTTRPDWAVAEIVAERHEDRSDLQTDYFAHRVAERIHLAWSRHGRDDFRELRKAAATDERTAHLGPGRDIFNVEVVIASAFAHNGYAYEPGERSHWHGDAQTVETLAEAQALAALPEPEGMYFGDVWVTFARRIRRTSIEHREKYSMGQGYYLKASRYAHADGWTVRKERRQA